jgi:hypothetical protein
MSCFASNARFPRIFAQSLIAGILAAGMFGWSAVGEEGATTPNFSLDSRIGWIAGDPNGPTPIGDDFLPQPPGAGLGPVMSDKDHPYIDNRLAREKHLQPTNRVADLSNPILQPWAREQLRKLNERALTETMLLTPKERCWPIGVPGWMLYPARPVYFLQTSKEVVLIWEEDHMVRHIYLTDKHPPNVKPSWFGDSIGHYENGDTLVVDTIGLTTRTFVDSYRTPHTDQLHVVERYRIIEGGKALEAIAYVEDPGAFTTPWTAFQRYRRVEQGPLVRKFAPKTMPLFSTMMWSRFLTLTSRISDSQIMVDRGNHPIRQARCGNVAAPSGGA